MAISLAPIRYRNVFSEHGGPIGRLEAFPQKTSDGRERHSSNAFLIESLRPAWVSKMRLYADADGSGTHAVRNIACYIAISEALERWAYYGASDGALRRECAFDKDDSTTGMAAFPGLLKNSVRARAALEAAERWSVVEWWLGRLPSRLIRHEGMEGALEILSPFPRCAVAVTWHRGPSGGLAFGFAAGAALKDALQHARVEQDRNIVALESPARGREAGELPSCLERRLAFFSSAAGEALFHARREASAAMSAVPALPRTLTDREIPGPWGRYTTVWRVLYEQTSQDHLDETRDDFFQF